MLKNYDMEKEGDGLFILNKKKKHLVNFNQKKITSKDEQCRRT